MLRHGSQGADDAPALEFDEVMVRVGGIPERLPHHAQLDLEAIEASSRDLHLLLRGHLGFQVNDVAAAQAGEDVEYGLIVGGQRQPPH